ncbi:MAG: DUF1648 domain-containing protein [Myxococcales bacterium]|nr:DUF1648 domain-containing protein [Myxococcales bacterium]
MLSRIILASTIVTVVLVVWLVARTDRERVFYMDLGRKLDANDRARVRRVRVVTLGSALIGVAGAAFTPIPTAVLVSTLLPFVPIVWLLIEVVGAVKSAKPMEASLRFRVPLTDPPPAKQYVSLPLQVAQGALVLLSAAAFVLVRSHLPELVPLHFDAAGRPNRWGSPDELWALGGIMLFCWALSWLIVVGVAKERWALPTTQTEAYARASRRRRSLLVRMVEVLMLCVNGAVAVSWLGIALGSLPGMSHLLAISVVAALVLSAGGAVGSLVAFLAPLAAVQRELTALGGVALGTRPDGWRWGGMIYYAPDDPALFIPKRIGIGQTFNFARPAAWLILIVLLVVPIGIAFTSMLLSRR